MTDDVTREANRLRQRTWRAANPERWKEINRASQLKRRGKISSRRKAKRAEDRDRLRGESLSAKVDRLNKANAKSEALAIACATMCVNHEQANSFLIVERGKAALRLLGVLPKETAIYTVNRDPQSGLWSNALEDWHNGQQRLREAMEP